MHFLVVMLLNDKQDKAGPPRPGCSALNRILNSFQDVAVHYYQEIGLILQANIPMVKSIARVVTSNHEYQVFSY